MFGQIYAHDTIRKYVIFFGTLFSDINLIRGEEDAPTQTMRVPLNYGPKEKFLARAEGNPDADRKIAIQLPRMAFEIMGVEYDAERKLSTTGKIRGADPDFPNKLQYQYNPVPWNIHFNLYIMVKNAVDGTRIIEQILPFFDPDFTATLKVNPDLGMNYDVPLVLNNADLMDTYEGSFETRRAIIWTLSFTLKGWIFGPTRSGNIIKQVEVYFRVPPNGVVIADAIGNTDPSISITITPGLTANGEPTSNSALTIDKNLIEKDDQWGFITEFTETL